MKVRVRRSGALFSLLALTAASASASGLNEVVQVRDGKISGVAVQDGGEKVHVFKGIPYAAPPVGVLRWKAPQPVKAWSGVREATKWSNQCAQRAGSSMGEAGTISEDCLYLNVVADCIAARKGPVPQSHRRERLGFCLGGAHDDARAR